MLPLTPIITALVIATATCLGATAGIAASDRQIALGVSQADWWDIDNSGDDAVDTATTELGAKPAIWSLWSDWGGPNKDFPTTLVQGLHARRVVPMVYWEPVDPSFQGFDCSHWALKNIINDDHDDYIRQWARLRRTMATRSSCVSPTR